jgi:hypothetical protein
VHTAHISTGRDGQRTLKTTAPSSPCYDGGAHFRRHVRMNCKKMARIKMLVNKTFGARQCRSFKQILSSELLKTKKAKMTKTTANIVVAIAATLCKVQQ